MALFEIPPDGLLSNFKSLAEREDVSRSNHSIKDLSASKFQQSLILRAQR
ncbi:hypothetical protein Csa_018390 [Cucumis sativus]|nr:hypothetical protein Csa_018390 [Cucumis sativus]